MIKLQREYLCICIVSLLLFILMMMFIFIKRSRQSQRERQNESKYALYALMIEQDVGGLDRNLLKQKLMSEKAVSKQSSDLERQET